MATAATPTMPRIWLRFIAQLSLTPSTHRLRE
jgi:hypothetical protein